MNGPALDWMPDASQATDLGWRSMLLNARLI
jgi:hypothetical protein